MLLELAGVSVAYGPVVALREVSLRVAANAITAIVGSNGAGKSTCLKSVSGVVRLHAGSVLYDGLPIHHLPAERRLRLGIAHVMEGRRLFGDLTVAENIRLGAYLRRDPAAIAADRDRLFARFPVLGQRRHQLAGTMSGGEQQMLAFAVALMSRPRLLLLDEPSLGLAPRMVQTVAALIRQLRAEGLTILLVEQQAAMALSLADDAYVFARGRIAASGSSAAVMADGRVRDAYFGAGAVA